MIFEFDECNCCDSDILRDIAKYNDVTKWLQAILDGTAEFRPLYLRATIGGKNYKILECDVLEDFEKVIKKVARMPKPMRHIPNDSLEIVADDFERELSIKLTMN